MKTNQSTQEKEFERKYNFNIDLPVDDLERRQPIDQPNAQATQGNVISTKENTDQLNNTQDYNNPEYRKAEYDALTYHDMLKRKIKLNYQLAKIVLQNYHKDEFQNTRRSAYALFGLPLGLKSYFMLFNSHNPFANYLFGISLFSCFITVVYFYSEDIKNISGDPISKIGRQVRLIRNELSLYNIMIKPTLEDEKQSIRD